MSVAVRTKSIFIVGLLFFSLMSSINIGNPTIASIETESSPQASDDASTTEMVKASQVDFTSDRMIISQGEGSHTPLAVDVHEDMVCQGGFFSGSIQINNTSFHANGLKGYIHCDSLQGEKALTFTPPSGSNVAKVQDLKIFNSTNLVVVGTFENGTRTGSFISSIEINATSITSVKTRVIIHCTDGGIRHFEILKVDGTLDQSYAVGTIRNHGQSGNNLCSSNSSQSTFSDKNVDISSVSDSLQLNTTTDNKSFIVNFSFSSDDFVVHQLENDNTVHFTSLEYVGPNEVYISYYIPGQGNCPSPDYYTEAGYYKWNGTNLSKVESLCGENLKFRDLTKSGSSVYLIGDAMNLREGFCVNQQCSGSGALDVVVYNANQRKGVLLGGQLLDYGFSIDSHESELIIGGSFESVVPSLGLSSNDEEDGFVASIDLAAGFTLNWANGVGGIGIDLITDVAIKESNGNVFVTGMISDSGQAGSVDYNVMIYEHLKTKSFVGYLNVSNVLPVPLIHSYESLQVALDSPSIITTAFVHHLEVDEYDLIEYRFNDSDMSIDVTYSDERMYVNRTQGNYSVSLFLVLEPGSKMPIGYFIAKHLTEYGMCSIDNQYFTILCHSGTSSEYFEYSPENENYVWKHEKPTTITGHYLWSNHKSSSSSEQTGYCSSDLNAKNNKFAHIDGSSIAFVKNALPHNLVKYNIQNCSSPQNSSNTIPGTIGEMSGTEEGNFFIRTTTTTNISSSSCREETFNIYNSSLELIDTKVIDYCDADGTYNHLYRVNSELHGMELHISASFGPRIQSVSVNSTLIYNQSNASANVSHIMMINLVNDKVMENIIYSENQATAAIGVLDEGVLVACLRSMEDGSLGHLSYGDDFSKTTDKNSLCMAIGSNEEYSHNEFNSDALMPTSYGFVKIGHHQPGHHHTLSRSVYSFMDINSTVDGVEYDGRTIFVDYKTDFSLQFQTDPTRMQPNEWSMTTLASDTTWLSLDAQTGNLSGAYTADASNASELPCSEFIITAAYETSDNQEVYEAHYSHAVEICVQSVEVDTITYGTNNVLEVVYGNNDLSALPVYSGGPIDKFSIISLISEGVSIDDTGVLTVESRNATPGNHTVFYTYTHDGKNVTNHVDVNININYTINPPQVTDLFLISPHMGSSMTLDFQGTALFNGSNISHDYTPPPLESGFVCENLTSSNFNVVFNETSRILTIRSDASAANNCKQYTENAGNLTIEVSNEEYFTTLEIGIETVPKLSDYDVIYPDREVQQVFGVFSVAPEYRGQTFVCNECKYQLDPPNGYRAGISMNQGNITYVAHRGPITEQYTVNITYPDVSGTGDTTIRALFNLTTLPVQPVFEKHDMQVELIAGQDIYYPPESPGISNPLNWTISVGSLPIGLSMDSDSGVISGDTDDIGTHTVRVNAKSIGGSDSYSLTLYVIAPPSEAHYATNHVNLYGGVEIDPIMLQNNVNNIGDWVAHITLPNGQEEIGWGLSDTHLGLSIDGNGTISGTPVWNEYDNSTYDDIIELHVKLSAQEDVNINTNEPSILISIHKPTFEEPYFDDDNIEITTVLGTDFVFNPPTAHAKISEWEMTFADQNSNSDWVSSGLQFDEITGSIYGRSQANTANMQLIITAKTNVQQQDSFNLNITILNPGLESVYYPHTTLHLLGGDQMENFAPVIPSNRMLSFTAIDGLPGGLSIDSSTGVISGTPSLSSVPSADSMAIYRIVVSEPHVTENSTMELIIHIHNPEADLGFALNETSVSFVAGEPINFELQYPGGTGELSWTTSALPEGLMLFTENNSSWIRGTPTILGTSSIQVSVSDSTTATVTYTQNITVVEKDPLLHYAMDKIYLHLGQDLDASPICPDIEISIHRYEIDPTPIANLEFNTSTGCISGTPSVISNSASPYSISGFTLSGQSKTFDLQLIVSGLRSDYFLVDSPALQLIDYNDIIYYPYQNQYLSYGSYLADDLPQSKIGQLSQFTIEPDISVLGDYVYFNNATGELSGLPTRATTDGGIIFTIKAIWQYNLADGTYISTEVSTEYKIIVKSGESNYVDERFVVGGKLSISPSNAYSEFDKYELYGMLPMGVSFDPETGVLSGTPQESGEFALHIVASSDDGTQVDYYVEFEIEERENNPWKVVFIFAILGLLFTVMRFVDGMKESSQSHTTKDFDQHHEEE